MPSLPLSAVMLPPRIVITPFSASSAFSEWIASVPAVIEIVPSAMLTLSLPERPCLAASTVIVPEAIFRSSFETMPCPVSHFTLRLPVPFTVRSHLEKTAPSAFTSPKGASSPVAETELSVPSASVRNTLSAFSTTIADWPLLSITASERMSWILALSSASITILPEKLPLSR